MNRCIDCDKKINNKAKRCQSHAIRFRLRDSVCQKNHKKIISFINKGFTLKQVANEIGLKSSVTIFNYLKIRNIHVIRNTKGERSPTWKGGRLIKKGYVYVYSPRHPYKNKNNQVAEHRLVMEKKLGRYLLPTEVVHHKNHMKNDNRPENLQLYSSPGWHSMIEHADRDPITGRFYKRGIIKT